MVPASEHDIPSSPAALSLQSDASVLAAQARSRVLAELLRHVLQGQELERRQLARLLHDELAQTLAAIKIRLQSEMGHGSQRANSADSETIRIIDDALLLVRRLVPTLRPAVLDDLGLVPALRDLAIHTKDRTGLPVFVRCQPGADQIRLQPELESAAFRVAQEALANVVRHAKATRIDVHLRHEADKLVVEVHDDGCGFQPLAAQYDAGDGDVQGMGLLLMQERATVLGGTLEIESAQGQGCRVRLICRIAPSRTVQ